MNVEVEGRDLSSPLKRIWGFGGQERNDEYWNWFQTALKFVKEWRADCNSIPTGLSNTYHSSRFPVIVLLERPGQCTSDYPQSLWLTSPPLPCATATSLAYPTPSASPSQTADILQLFFSPTASRTSPRGIGQTHTKHPRTRIARPNTAQHSACASQKPHTRQNGAPTSSKPSRAILAPPHRAHNTIRLPLARSARTPAPRPLRLHLLAAAAILLRARAGRRAGVLGCRAVVYASYHLCRLLRRKLRRRRVSRRGIIVNARG
jgi:hypothetical protein